MKNLNITFIVWIFAMIISLISCEKHEQLGKWNPIEWNIENQTPRNIGVSKGGESITVNYQGGSLDLICTNYNILWFSGLHSVGLNSTDKPDYEIKELKSEWYNITLRDNTLHFEFKKRDISAEPKLISLTVTAGDIFYTFKIASRPYKNE